MKGHFQHKREESLISQQAKAPQVKIRVHNHIQGRYQTSLGPGSSVARAAQSSTWANLSHSLAKASAEPVFRMVCCAGTLTPAALLASVLAEAMKSSQLVRVRDPKLSYQDWSSHSISITEVSVPLCLLGALRGYCLLGSHSRQLLIVNNLFTEAPIFASFHPAFSYLSSTPPHSYFLQANRAIKLGRDMYI